MLSIQECEAILNKKEKKYSYEEVKQVRDFLLTICEIEYDVLQESTFFKNGGALSQSFN
jgi:hypothetical protein